MFNAKGWLRGLKPFEPVVISLSDRNTLFRRIESITENTVFQEKAFVMTVGRFIMSCALRANVLNAAAGTRRSSAEEIS